MHRVEYVRIELHNPAFFHYLFHGLCNTESLSAQRKRGSNERKTLTTLTLNTVSLSASYPPAKLAVFVALHNTRLCWFGVRGALFSWCLTCGGSATAECRRSKCELNC